MGTEDILDRFDVEYEKLVDYLETFQLQCNEYGKGSNEMRVSDIDASYSELKKSLKKIRKLAKEVKHESR